MSSGEAPTIIRGKCTLQPHVPGDGGVLSKAQILMEKLIRRGARIGALSIAL